MEEIKERDNQIKVVTLKINELLLGFDKSPRKAQDLDQMKDYLSEFQTALDGLKIELRSSSVEQSQSEKREWRKSTRKPLTS